LESPVLIFTEFSTLRLYYFRGGLPAQASFQRAIPDDWEHDLSSRFTAWVRLVHGYLFLITYQYSNANISFQDCLSYSEQIGEEILIQYAQQGLKEIKIQSR